MKSPKQHLACPEGSSDPVDDVARHGLRRGASWLSDQVETVTGEQAAPDFALAWAADCGEGRTMRLRTIQSLDEPLPKQLNQDDLLVWLGRPVVSMGHGNWSAFLPLLSQDERERMLRFHFAVDRWSFGAAHAGLRHLLATVLGVKPYDLRFVHGPAGKPMLCPDTQGAGVAGDLWFNISHTRGMVAVALSGSPVGIDVEPIRHLPDLVALARTHMAAEEQDHLNSCADQAAADQMFFRFWTLGEAFIKATGQGLDQGLSTFAFSPAGTPRLDRVTPGWEPVERWQFGLIGAMSGRNC